MSLLTAPIAKNSHIYVYLSKKRPKPILEVLQCKILTSVKKLEKQSASKADFSTFLQLSCSNFRLKLCEIP